MRGFVIKIFVLAITGTIPIFYKTMKTPSIVLVQWENSESIFGIKSISIRSLNTLMVNFLGNFLKTENRLRLEPIKNYFLDANLNWQSAAPNLNLLNNYSPIERYNWGGNAFKNENIMEIGGSMGLKLGLTAKFS